MSDEVSGFSAYPMPGPVSLADTTGPSEAVEVASLNLTTPSTTASENMLVTYRGTLISAGAEAGCYLEVNGTTIAEQSVAVPNVAGGAIGTGAVSITAGVVVPPGQNNNVEVECAGGGTMQDRSLTAVIH
jgi:hypothetical protein